MTTLEPTPLRAPRGRVVVVGDVALGRTISELLTTPAVDADNIFDAVGTISNASSREPIIAMICRTENLGRDPLQAANAIGSVDPAVRLVLLSDNQVNEPELHERGFDACLVEPVDADQLARALDGSASRPANEPRATGVDAPSAAPLPPETAAPPVLEAVPPRPGATDRLATGALRDVDLVAAVLGGGSALADVAIRMIVQQTGWTDLQFMDTEDHPPDGAIAAMVVDDEERYGSLASATADPRQLADWAGWLANWLALDRSYRTYQRWSFRDDLTGAWNRRFFESYLDETIEKARACRRPVTIMVFDIDDFKVYNDRFGHEAGDDILREIVRLLHSMIRGSDQVCRIGGDEFVVVFADIDGPRDPGSSHPDTVEGMVRRFQNQVCQMKFPKLGTEAPGALSISAGLATFPWDGHDVRSLVRHADRLALQSKRAGKNTITLGPGAKSICGEEGT